MGWLITILRNAYYNEYKKGRREVADPGGGNSGIACIPARPKRAYGFTRFPRGAATIAAGLARSAHSYGSLGLFL
jgi:hypothetical protein